MHRTKKRKDIILDRVLTLRITNEDYRLLRSIKNNDPESYRNYSDVVREGIRSIKREQKYTSLFSSMKEKTEVDAPSEPMPVIFFDNYYWA
jgi:Arc/MetJ-type ribon-helix-helix transcriptional regulator